MLWNVELPAATPFRKGECRGQVIEEVATGDFFRTEAHDMRRGLLAVYDAEFPGL